MAYLEMVGVIGSPLDVLKLLVNGFGDAVFYSLIANYLDAEILNAFNRLFTRSLQWVISVAGIMFSLWVWWQGWKIMTGQSQESMARFFATTAQRVFILGLAFGATLGSSNVFYWLGNELPKEVNYIVTGQFQSPATGIDKNLAYMQLALSSIDVLQTGGDEAVQDAKTRSMWFAAVGTAGPAVVGGAMLLLNKIAMGLFVGLGPLFVLCLIFDYTKPLFQKWLYYGLGTIFALVLLNLMIGIATEMVTRVSAALWMGNFVSTLMGGGATEGISSRALQQGGLGLILTMLIVTTPPMAAAFFNGVMGQFQAYSAFQGGVGAGARGPGSPPAQGPQMVNQGNAGRIDVGGNVQQSGNAFRPQDIGIGRQGVAGQADGVAPSSGGDRGLATSYPAPEVPRVPSSATGAQGPTYSPPASTPPAPLQPRSTDPRA